MESMAKFIIFIILGPVILSVSYWYFTNLDDVAIWIWIWALGFGWVIHSKATFQTRGLLFIFLSVTTAVVGQQYFVGEEYKKYFLSVNVMSQIMIIIGSGLGANLISHWLINEKTPNNKINKD